MEGSAADSELGGCGRFLNPKLLSLKLVYFTYISSLTVIRPYLALYMSGLGLGEFQVGLLRCLQPAAIVVFSPMWGSIADKYQNRKFLLVLCAFGSAVFLPALLFVPPLDVLSLFSSDEVSAEEKITNVTINSTVEYTRQDDGAFPGTTSSIFPLNSLLTFALTALVSFMDDVFIAGFLPLFDAQTMALVERYPKSSYGGQRWTGALAVVVFSPVIGLLTDWYGGVVTGREVYFLQSSYLPSFVLFAFLMVVSMVPVLKTEEVLSFPPPSFSRELLAVLRQFHIVVTFAVFIVAGACQGLVSAFLFIYLEELGASKFLMSLSLVATCVVEVPCLLISNRVIKTIGYEAVICVGLLAYGVRLYAYSVLVDPWWVLPIELLHGICHGILWPACTEYASHIAPEGMGSTLQSLVHAAKAGVGTGEVLGMTVGGLIYNIYGARTLYLQLAVVAIAVMMVYLLDSLYAGLRWCNPADENANNIEERKNESEPFFREKRDRRELATP